MEKYRSGVNAFGLACKMTTEILWRSIRRLFLCREAIGVTLKDDSWKIGPTSSRFVSSLINRAILVGRSWRWGPRDYLGGESCQTGDSASGVAIAVGVGFIVELRMVALEQIIL